MGIVFHGTKTQVRESCPWLWANRSASVLLDTEAQTSFPRSLRHSFSHCNFPSPADMFFGTPRAMQGLGSNLHPLAADASTPFRPAPFIGIMKGVLVGGYGENHRHFCIKLRTTQCPCFPAYILGDLRHVCFLILCGHLSETALWCSVETRWQCLQVYEGVHDFRFPAKFSSQTLGGCGLGATRVPCRCHILEFKYSNAAEVTCNTVISMFVSWLLCELLHSAEVLTNASTEHLQLLLTCFFFP